MCEYFFNLSNVCLYFFSPIATFVVGSLPNLQHGIGGTFEILSTTRIRLNDFSYDGQGPGILF